MCMQVREISNQMLREPFRWTAEALLALQEVRSKRAYKDGHACCCCSCILFAG